MIFDCFPFFNELDLLKIRFEELYKTVDKFILVEATKTHSGKIKPLYFQENRHLFRKYEDKIIYHLADDLPTSGNAWKLERAQRNRIQAILKENNADDNDRYNLSLNIKTKPAT